MRQKFNYQNKNQNYHNSYIALRKAHLQYALFIDIDNWLTVFECTFRGTATMKAIALRPIKFALKLGLICAPRMSRRIFDFYLNIEG